MDETRISDVKKPATIIALLIVGTPARVSGVEGRLLCGHPSTEPITHRNQN